MTMENLSTISEIFGIIAPVMLALLYSGFWMTFFRESRKIRDIFFVILIDSIILFFGFSNISYDIKLPLSPLMLILTAVSFLYCLIFKTGSPQKAVFLNIFVFSLQAMGILISNSVLSLAQDKGLSKIDIDSEDAVGRIFLITGINLICWIILIAALYAAFFLIFRHSMEDIMELNTGDLIFLSAPHIVGIIFARMMISLSVVPLKNEVFVFFDERKDAVFKVPLMAVILLVGEYSELYVFKNYRRLLRERQQMLGNASQLKMLKARLNETDSFYSGIRGVKHDMKNHISNIRGLISSGSYEAACEYVQTLSDTVDRLICRFNTGNPVCDVIINDKYNIAQKEDIPFSVDFQYTDNEKIPSFDIGIILSNLLDNAIEASVKEPADKRYINLKLKSGGPCIIITVKNYFSGTLSISGDDGLPISDKNTVGNDVFLKEHGLGLRNVLSISEKYCGSLGIELNGAEFCAVVMLNVPLAT